jgi:hypothetical protein
MRRSICRVTFLVIALVPAKIAAKGVGIPFGLAASRWDPPVGEQPAG